VIRATVVTAAILALGGCKQRSDGQAALAAMRDFTDRICACKDRACATKVQEEMARWSEDMARHGDPARPPDEATVKALTEVTTRFTTCMSAAMDGIFVPASTGPTAGAPFQIDAQLRSVRERAAHHPKKLVMSRLEINYARADGTLDPKYGTLEVSFAVPPAPPADDPNRPIGAPLPPPPSAQQDMDCPEWKFADGHWQQHETICMGMSVLAPAHCTIAQVWARAIADEAPPGALATLALEEGPPQQWLFTISDPPRNVDFRKTYADDCEPVLEKPAK
jgi:hypothetical protein